jgi:hypothetical protein
MPTQSCKLIFQYKILFIYFFISDPSYYSPTAYSMPEYQQPFASSTPLPSSNVCLVPLTKVRFKLFSPQLIVSNHFDNSS